MSQTLQELDQKVPFLKLNLIHHILSHLHIAKVQKYQIETLSVSFFYLIFKLYHNLLDALFKISQQLSHCLNFKINLFIDCYLFQTNDSHSLNQKDQLQRLTRERKKQAIPVS